MLLRMFVLEQAIREQLVQLMFETFNVSGFYASEQAVLSLYAVGRISGCTVDIGHGKIGILAWLFFAIQFDLTLCVSLLSHFLHFYVFAIKRLRDSRD